MAARSDAALRERLQEALEEVSCSTGDEFFRLLVRDLATALGVRYAMIAEVVDGERCSMTKGLACWIGDQFGETSVVDPTGTPCADVVDGRTVFVPENVAEAYPRLAELTVPEIESYIGLPVVDGKGAILGRLCALDVEPMAADLESEWTLKMFAARAAAEIERRRAERALRDSEERFRATFEHAAIGIAHVGLDKKFIRVNRTLCEILGYEEEELARLTFDEITHPDDRESSVAHRDRALSGEIDAYSLEKRYIRKNGSAVWANVTVSIARGAGGEPEYTISVVEDIDDDKRAERERRALEAKVLQAQKLESLGILAGGIAHDFNNLLTAILGNTSLAVDAAARSDVLEYLRNIESAGTRAAELTQQLLAYAGKGRFVIETIDLNALLREMQPLLQTAVSNRTRIEYELTDAPMLIRADAAQIRQVAMNLVTNASEALDDESGSIRIATGRERPDPDELSAATANSLPAGVDCVFIQIADDGSGMDAGTADRIFDPFFTTKFTGRGLGLAAVLGIVSGHRGAIRVESSVGVGTSIKVYFPLASVAAVDLAPGELGDSVRDCAQGTVLVIDDEPIVGEVSGAMLRKLGFEPYVVTSGRAGIDAIRSRREEIVAILLDLTMPEMGGESVFHDLRSIAPEIPVILMSGYNEQEATQRFVGQKLAGFLHKPFKPDQLREKLREALAKG